MNDTTEPVSAIPEPGAAEPAPEPAPAKPDPAWKRPWLWPLLAIAAVILGLSLVASLAVVVDLKSGGNYSAGSPEATVMSWAAAMNADDLSTANTFLSARARSGGTNSTMTQGSIKISIVSSTISGTKAAVIADLTLGGTSFTGIPDAVTRVTFNMVQEYGAWKIDGLSS